MKVCTYCGQEGHLAHACPRRPEDKPEPLTPEQAKLLLDIWCVPSRGLPREIEESGDA